MAGVQSGHGCDDAGGRLSALETGLLDDGSSDFADPFLRELIQPSLTVRVPLPGDRVGAGLRFYILEKLGEGGMGLVFKARDEALQRVVALKFVLPRSGNVDPSLLPLFRQEARVIAGFNHRNIVRLYDVADWVIPETDAPIPFLVMEHLEGESLAALLRRGPIGLPRALELMGGVAAGLAHAHERGVIHRDLKPSNVFVLGSGGVKILDFGLALLTTGSPEASHLRVAGTPTHMAPEQWRGAQVDARADVWAAGIVLFQLLTGEHPYRGADEDELRERVLSGEPVPSIRELRPDLPEGTERLLARALAKDPARRFPDAHELRKAVREVAASLTARQPWTRPTAPERRQVTWLSCWLSGSVAPAEHLNEEDFEELVARLHRGCAQIVQAHGGTVGTYLGQEVSACFGQTVAREDDAERAVLAGLEVIAAFQKALRERPELGRGLELAVSVGIHTGAVTLGDVSAGGYGVMPIIRGDVPGLAGWLARQAGPNAVVLSDTTHALVRGTFETERLGARTFEGLSGPVRVDVHRVLRERDVFIRFDRTIAAGRLTPFVGRARELDELVERWREAEVGGGSVVLMRGEAGIGKSRLIREVCERVTTRPGARLRFQCWSQFSNSALYPVIELLRHQLGISARARPEDAQHRLEVLLTRLGLLPEQRALIASLLGVPTRDGEPLIMRTPDREKERTFDALLALLARLSAASPVLIVGEDLHWADPSTLALLRVLGDHVGAMRLLVLLSARPGFMPSWPRRPWIHGIELERLPPESTAMLIEEAGGRGLSREVVGHLASKSDGIPLFAEEMTRMVLASPEAQRPGMTHAIPITLNELLRARLDALSSRQRGLAQLCSVIGRGFGHALLAALAGRGESALEDDLAGLVDAGLLQRERTAEPAYQFRHALIQEVAYQSLPRNARRRHHRRIAQVLRERFPRVVEEQPELVAHHLTEAGEMEPAIGYWVEAGERAGRRSAYLEGIGHLSQALRLFEQLPDAPRRAGDELRLRLLLGSLRQAQGYDAPELERTYARALELMRQSGTALPMLEIPLWGIYAFYFARAEFERAFEIAERLVAMGEQRRNPELLVLALRMRGTVRFTWGDMEAAIADIEHAVACCSFDVEQHRALALKHGMDSTVAALAYASVLYAVTGRPVRARQRGQQALLLAQEIGHPNTSAYAMTYVALSRQLLREVHHALNLAGENVAFSREHRIWLWEAWSRLILGWARAELGQVREGLESVLATLRQWRAGGVRAGMPFFFCMQGEMHLRLGELAEGLTAAREGLAMATVTGERSAVAELHRIEGQILGRLGDPVGARTALDCAIAVARRQGTRAFELRATLALCRLLVEWGAREEATLRLAAICGQLCHDPDWRDLREARALLDELQPTGDPGAGPAYAAPGVSWHAPRGP